MHRCTRAVQYFGRRHIHVSPRGVRPSRFEQERLDYKDLVDKLSKAKRVLGKHDKGLTLTEKIMYSHVDLASSSWSPSYQKFRPDRVACQDTTTTATPLVTLLQQWMASDDDIRRVAVPTTVHCEFIEQYDTALEAACSASGIGLWRPGAGSIHQVLFQNYGFPGGLMVGAGARAPNAGGIGMLGIDVEVTEAVAVMAGLQWELKTPRVTNVRLTGKLSGWASPKDIVLKIADLLKSQDTRGVVLEYSGPGIDTLSCTDMATVCNMGAELGATSSLFPFTQQTHAFLCATHRRELAQAAQTVAYTYLSADNNAQYDGGVIEIDLDTLEPYTSGPFAPDLSAPLSGFKAKVMEEEWPHVLSAAFIGPSSSYLDISRAAEVARHAAEKGLKVKVPFMVTPGSEQERATLERDNLLSLFEIVGGSLCLPDQRNDFEDYDKTWNSIVTSSALSKMQGGNPNTHVFIASAEIVMAMAFAGKLTFNPMLDRLVGTDGIPFKFNVPVHSKGEPSDGYCLGSTDAYYQAPGNGNSSTMNQQSSQLRSSTIWNDDYYMDQTVCADRINGSHAHNATDSIAQYPDTDRRRTPPARH